MPDRKIMIGDAMIETQLKENSDKLNISVEELICRYIKRGLYSDDYYIQPQLSKDELDEILKKDMERDKKRGIPPTNNNFDVFVGRWNKTDE